MSRAMLLLRIGVLVGFFGISLVLTFGFAGTFLSPDENANFTFASSVASGSGFCIQDDAARLAGGIVHPRSTLVVDGCIVPGSFIGLPLLAGAIGLVFGLWGSLLVTPILSLFAVICTWNLVRKVTRDEALADLAVIFSFAHPAWLYYCGRVMMHNIAFVAWLLIGLWFAVCAFPKHRVWGMAASGAAVGLAVAMRTFEATWVLALVVAGMLAFRRHLTRGFFVSWIAGFVVAVAVVATGNMLTYGSPLTTGYTVDVPGAAAAPSVGVAVAPAWSLPAWLEYAFPFGFDPKAILKNSWWYGVALFPWATMLAVLGFAFALRDSRRAVRAVAWVTLGLTVWLAVVYGSWTFADNPDPRAVTIGNSHVRYWLPLFVLGGWLVAYVVRMAWAWLATKSRLWANVALVVVLVVWTGLSAMIVFGGTDGFLAARKALASFETKREVVLANTEEHAVVIVDRADKFVFPHRSVVVPLRSDATYAAMPELVAAGPLYYFGITLPERDVAYLNDVKLAVLGLRLERVTSVNEESLYRIVPASGL